MPFYIQPYIEHQVLSDSLQTGEMPFWDGAHFARTNGLTFDDTGYFPTLEWTQDPGNAAMIMRRFQTRSGNYPPWQEFITENSNSNPDTYTYNYCWSFGPNHVGGGSRVDNNFPSAYWQWEYIYDTDLNAGHPTIEWHYDVIMPDGTLFRPHGMDIDVGSVTPQHMTWYIRPDVAYITAPNGVDIVTQWTIDDDDNDNNQVIQYGTTYLRGRAASGNTLYVQSENGIWNALQVNTDVVSGFYTIVGGALYMAGAGPAGAKIATNGAFDLKLGRSYNEDFVIGAGGFTIRDALNFTFSGTTGTKFGTATSEKMGWWNAAPVAQQTVSGSRGSGAALVSLLDTLELLGLIVDGTSA